MSDGTHTANISMLGQYSTQGFQLASDGGAGSVISYLLSTQTQQI